MGHGPRYSSIKIQEYIDSQVIYNDVDTSTKRFIVLWLASKKFQKEISHDPNGPFAPSEPGKLPKKEVKREPKEVQPKSPIADFTQKVINHVWEGSKGAVKMHKGPPKVKFFDIIEGANAYYFPSEHTINMSMTSIKSDELVKAINKFKSLTPEEGSYYYRTSYLAKYSGVTNMPSTLAHELCHAFQGADHKSGAHTGFKIMLGTKEFDKNFNKTAILLWNNGFAGFRY